MTVTEKCGAESSLDDAEGVTDSRPRWLRWWHRKTIPPSPYALNVKAEFLVRTRIRLKLSHRLLVLLGRDVVMEAWTEADVDLNDPNVVGVFDDFQTAAWTEPRHD